ncbi:hypothetical protein [Bowdeniella nasicola]|uniref:hypothetical protein n=1 Tax=Bowdeniella nasicola TaxID=208480 RepID=UPI00115FF23A|nr:hypothetical protein [Bowdeniella nasicola]
MTTSDRQQRPRRRKRRKQASGLSIAAAGAMIAGALSPSPAWATEVTVTTGAELIQAIEDANATPGFDTITINAPIVLEADLPQITDGLFIQGVNGAAVDGNAGAHRAIIAENIDLLSIEGVDFRALRGSAIHASDVAELVIFSVGVEQATGHGVYVYGNGTRIEKSARRR